MFNCFIYDLDFYSQELINLISQIDNLEVTGHGSRISPATINRQNPDVIFADITLVKTNYPRFSDVSKGRAVVYTSEAPEFAIHEFKNKGIGYLLKPYNMKAVVNCVIQIQESTIVQLEKKLSSFTVRKDSFFVRTEFKGARTVRILIDSVIHIESLDNYITIHLVNEKKIICYITLKEIEEQLPNEIFSRINRSYIINNTKISEINGNCVILSNNKEFPIGPSFKQDFFAKIERETIRTKRYHKKAR